MRRKFPECKLDPDELSGKGPIERETNMNAKLFFLQLSIFVVYVHAKCSFSAGGSTYDLSALDSTYTYVLRFQFYLSHTNEIL